MGIRGKWDVNGRYLSLPFLIVLNPVINTESKAQNSIWRVSLGDIGMCRLSVSWRTRPRRGCYGPPSPQFPFSPPPLPHLYTQILCSALCFFLSPDFHGSQELSILITSLVLPRRFLLTFSHAPGGWYSWWFGLSPIHVIGSGYGLWGFDSRTTLNTFLCP